MFQDELIGQLAAELRRTDSSNGIVETAELERLEGATEDYNRPISPLTAEVGPIRLMALHLLRFKSSVCLLRAETDIVMLFPFVMPAAALTRARESTT